MSKIEETTKTTKTIGKGDFIQLTETKNSEQQHQWNYRNEDLNVLTDDFKKKYLININENKKSKNGYPLPVKEFILYEGLKAIAMKKGIKSLKTEIIQYPNASNQNTAIVIANLIGYGWDHVEDKMTTVEFSEIGDCSPASASHPGLAVHSIRIASTRAIARTFRLYTNIGYTAFEELGDTVEERIIPATEDQIKSLNNLVNSYKTESYKASHIVREICKETFGTDNPRSLTRNQFEVFLPLIEARFKGDKAKNSNDNTHK